MIALPILRRCRHLLLIALAIGASPAADLRQDVLRRLDTEQRRQLRDLRSFAPAELDTLREAADPDALRADTEALLATAPLALSLRQPDGPAPIDWLRKRLATVPELQWLGELQVPVPVPVSLDQAGTLGARGDTRTLLEVGEEHLPLHPFWPNGALPNLAPAGGLSGKLIDARDGGWDSLRGQDPRGAIVLLDFRAGRAWNRLMDLGAQAVIAIEDDFVSRPLAEQWFANTPLPVPRYYVDRETGARLRARVGQTAVIHGGNWIENRDARSAFAWLPPAPAMALRIREGELLERIAAQYGVAAADLRELNRLGADDPPVGSSLDIPGRDKPHTIVANELLNRIAADAGVGAETLLAANPGIDPSLPAGTELRVPPLGNPLVVVVRTDAVSSVPGLPHGATAAANLAAAVRLIESAAAMPAGSRRRGLLVAFLDGDVTGGQASRLLLETHALLAGKLAPAVIALNQGTDADTLFRHYEAVESWLNDPSASPLPADSAEWFVREWLRNALEQYRIRLAEARAARVVRGGAPEELNLLLGQIDAVVALRAQTLENEKLSWAERAGKFLERLDGELTGAPDVPAQTRADYAARLRQEVNEERAARRRNAINRSTVTRVLEALYPDGRRPSLDRPLLGWMLDLSSGTPHLTLGAVNDYRNLPVFNERARRALVERIDRLHAFASSLAGWEEDWNFVGNDVAGVFAVRNVNPAPSYAEFWQELGVALMPLRPAGDARLSLDTPRDTLSSVDFKALSRLVRTSLLVARVSLESARDAAPGQSLKSRPIGRLTGQTTQFNVRSGIDAKEPVPNTLLHLPAIRVNGVVPPDWGGHNTLAYMGTRIAVQRFSRLNGRFEMPLEIRGFGGKSSLHAYRADAVSGLFERVMDAGQTGTQRQSPSFHLEEGRDSWKNVVLYRLYPLVISPGVDPLTYSEASTEAGLPTVNDAILKGPPRHIALEHPRVHFGESDLSGLLLYMEPGRSATLIDRRQGNIRGLLLGELEANPRSISGRGMNIGPRGDDRNLVLPLAPLAVARSMLEVCERRRDIYSAFGIRDQELYRTLDLARTKIDAADRHVEALQWREAVGAAREGWGLLAKNYPAMLKLGREAVLSVVILMALLAPTALFLERLVLGGKHIIARLGGTVALFILGTLFLSFFHPAFKIATSPFIVVIAFTMILMAAIVLSLCYGRFEVLVRRARIEGGEAESEEISLASSLATAFSLGVSNLKKRPTRTLLTAFTVTVLTFSIVSFVSVRGRDTLFLRPVPVDLRVNGIEQPADRILAPVTDGALFREFSWAPLSGDFISAVETEFGSRFETARRFHYIEVAGGNNASQEGVNQIEVRRGGRSEIVTALMGYEPSETRFSGLQRAVSGGTWFQSGDRFHVILPARVAEALDIAPSSLVDAEGNRLPDDQLPEVVMMNNRWRVIGILDTDMADRIRDLNGKPPALVDYLRSAITPQMGSGRLETEDEHLHMSFDQLALLPVSARGDVDGVWNSLVLRFPDGFDFAAFRDELARRMDRAMYARVGGKVSLLSARKQGSIGGLAKVLVPVILCVLIVSNTMMGTVDERVGEVQMLGAIGLSPAQISFLLLSESTVFSCIGILFGTFAGLLFSRIAGFFPDSLGLLSFNFTSLASTFLALGTGGIVLLATLLPARRAAALAAPSGMEAWVLPPPESGGVIHFRLPFTLTRGNATGMAAFFRRFLSNHVDSSSADFISKGAAIEAGRDGALHVRGRLWLAPYDLDVSQELSLDIEPSSAEGVFEVTIHLKRGSGSEDAWLRTNYGFLNLVRRQFLLWRNLDSSLRRRYIREGAEELQRTEAT